MWTHIAHRKKHSMTTSGFTIIEMLVAIGIFLLLSSPFLINYNTFNKRVTLDTLAHQIGQWVRDAQVSAMSVKNSQTQTGTFPGYGLHFDISTPDRFVYFADLDSDSQYDPPVGLAKCGDIGVECEREILLLQGNTIDSLCGDAGALIAISAKCITVGADEASNVFDIVFTRPSLDAEISGDLLGVSFPTQYSRARITVASVTGYTRVIEVWVTGQISVQ